MRLVTKLVVDKATDDRILTLAYAMHNTVNDNERTANSIMQAEKQQANLDGARQALLTEVRRLIQQAYKMGAEQ